MTTYDDQRVLFVRTPDRVIEIAFEGDGIKADLSEFDLGDFIEIPAEPGVYIWEGAYEYSPRGWAGSEPVDADSQWSGETRLATEVDLAAFGLASALALDEARAVVSVLSAEEHAAALARYGFTCQGGTLENAIAYSDLLADYRTLTGAVAALRGAARATRDRTIAVCEIVAQEMAARPEVSIEAGIGAVAALQEVVRRVRADETTPDQADRTPWRVL